MKQKVTQQYLEKFRKAIGNAVKTKQATIADLRGMRPLTKEELAWIDAAWKIFMKTPNLLHNEKGEVRPELYMQSKDDLDALQLHLPSKDEIRKTFGSDAIPEALDKLDSGDVIYIQPQYLVANKFGGRMTFIACSGMSRGGATMFCRTDDGGGGFVGEDMLVDPNNPTLQ